MAMVLSEAPLRERLLSPGSPWQEVECSDEVDSTNAASLRSPRPWRVVTTRHQHSGRGRHTRAWESPVGASAALSLTVPMVADPARWGWLPLITGLAVTEALGEVTGRPEAFALKWPNDVLAVDPAVPDTPGAPGGPGWGKLCGILCETATGAGQPLVVAGIGINLTSSRDQLPVPHATSLALAGLAADPDPVDVVVAVARRFAVRHTQWSEGEAGLEELRTAYRGRCSTLGRDVAVHLPAEKVVRGRAVQVADDGEIVVEVDGVRTPYAAGDVVHLRRA